MNDNAAVISIDCKKNRIRLHRTLLHQLGDPPYVLLLVNPEKRAIAVKALDHDEDQSHRVNQKLMNTDKSVDIYSHQLILSLCCVVENLDLGHTYHLYGESVLSERAVVFPMDSLEKVEQ